MRNMSDFYARYKQENLWCIKETGYYPALQNIRESQFSLGNGFIGTRGVLEEIPIGARPGTFFAGIYDRMLSQVAELVNFPNPFNFKFTIRGEKIGTATMDIIEHERILNMHKGLLLRKTIYLDSKKRRYDYQSLRFISMANKNIGGMQIIITPLDDNVEIELYTGIDTAVHNAETATEGKKKHFRIKELYYRKNINYLAVETLEKHYRVFYYTGFYYTINGRKFYGTDNVLRLKLRKGTPLVITKLIYMDASRSEENIFHKKKKEGYKQFRAVFKTNFSSLLRAHIKAWGKLWKIADISITTEEENIQNNLRFNIYHMLICAHKNDGLSSIGARTLSGEGYRGHVFWDADIFNLPFYAYTLPDVAKNMLLYRYRRLDAARNIAKEKGFRGALFPWESADTGEEETPTWARNIDGTIIKIKTDKMEHHIAADVAYACYNYFLITGDNQFMRRYGYEIILETARFWASRAKKEGKHYVIKNVIGPDEFHENVNNNAYTNMMARWNLLTAYNIVLSLKETAPRTFRRLERKLKLSPEEYILWRKVAHGLKINIRKDYIIEQFDGFFKKRFIKLTEFDENGLPLLPRNIRVKDYSKTQLVKQADVVMLLYLLRERFSRRTKLNNFTYYTKRTLHKSSLSPSIYSLLASDIGKIHDAYRFFKVTLNTDVGNIHSNTAEGIHAAALGGTWQAVINGFCGIQVKEKKNILTVNPHLPARWRSIHCSFYFRNLLIKMTLKKDAVSVYIHSPKKEKVAMEVFSKTCYIPTNKNFTVHKTRRCYDAKKEYKKK